jgi:hypothetical protein
MKAQDVITSKIHSFETSLAGDVDDFVEAALHAKMKHYDSIASQFSKFFHEDELANRFAAKVDVDRFK